MLGFCALSEAPISDLGDKSVYAAAQISAYAEASAFASVFYDVSGNIVCYADVAAYPNEIYWAYANVNGTAEVSALAQNISSAIAYIDGNATVSAYANSIFLFTADINAEADVTANGYRIQFADASISGFADLTVLSNVVYSDSAFVECNAYVTGLANATYSGYGFINANASIVTKGVIVGEGWTPVVPGAEVWSDITPSSDVWTALTPSTDYWTNINPENINNGGDYEAFGREQYPEIDNISVETNTTTLVANGTNGNSIYFGGPSGGIAEWDSDTAQFQLINYVNSQENSQEADFLWTSYYKNNDPRTNDIIYSNQFFSGGAYWISLVEVLIGKTSPPTLYDSNQHISYSDIYTIPATLNNVALGSYVSVPPNGIAILCAGVGLYYPDPNRYIASGISPEDLDIIMGAAVSPLNITNITDTSNLTWIKRSYVKTPYAITGSLYPAIAQEIWYAINNTSVAVTSNPTITYIDVFDSQTISLTSWSGVNLDSPFQNLIPTTNIWTETNPSEDTWLRQG